MTVNFIFPTVKVYNVQDRLDVVKGTSGEYEIMDDPGQLELFVNNDPVLNIEGNRITAANLGESRLRFMDASKTVVKEILIAVVSETDASAVSLGIAAGPPQPK